MVVQKLRSLISEGEQEEPMEKVEELKKSSRKVIRDVSLENGAIVAANSDKDYYPENVANYRFIWPRDAAFTLYGAELLGMEDLEKQFYEWLSSRAEGFEDSGIIYHRYSTNGPRDTDFGHQYQPDQAAALLWSMIETNDNYSERQEEIIHLLADGLWSRWSQNSFHTETHDLWEERQSYPDMNENFSYTLSACSEALYRAGTVLDERKWMKTAEEMKERLEKHEAEMNGRKYYPRSYGEVSDETIDASVLGLFWPFNVVEEDQKLQNSLDLVMEELMVEEGVMRYRGDMYDGMVHHTEHMKKGAGAWPLLTFWLVKVLSMRGREDEAEEIFHDQIGRINGEYIPEQVFNNDQQTGIKPLAWSHVMFLVAAEELGYL